MLVGVVVMRMEKVASRASLISVPPKSASMPSMCLVASSSVACRERDWVSDGLQRREVKTTTHLGVRATSLRP